jgi:hypothetical protein
MAEGGKVGDALAQQHSYGGRDGPMSIGISV